MTRIEKMIKDGYPKIIKGNGGYRAYLKDVQPLGGGDYMSIYRYPGGECCHSLEEIASAEQRALDMLKCVRYAAHYKHFAYIYR